MLRLDSVARLCHSENMNQTSIHNGCTRNSPAEDGSHQLAGTPGPLVLSHLPYGVTRYYAALAGSAPSTSDPIAAQFLPSPQENQTLSYEAADPLCDSRYMVCPGVIHHYHDRVLILITDRCATYCRHCFRRHFTGRSQGRMRAAALDKAVAYLKTVPQVEEIVLSGGDPLTLSDAVLCRVIQRLREGVTDRPLLFRLASRLPVVKPSRITPALVDALQKAGERRLWLVIQVNHPHELTPAFEKAVACFIDRGVPVLNQTVLLKGVNNKVSTLETLFRRLIQLRIKPYYLFQGDLAAGTAHFRTTIEEGLDLMDALRERLSGMAMPCYAVDLPEGGGKIPLTRSSIAEIREDVYILQDSRGRCYAYPRETGGSAHSDS